MRYRQGRGHQKAAEVGPLYQSFLGAWYWSSYIATALDQHPSS